MTKPSVPILVVGISSTALFDLAEADHVFGSRGIHAYRDYMLRHEDEPLQPGTGMPLVRAVLGLRRADGTDTSLPVEVVVMSQNSPETDVRILNTVRNLGLPISRFAFTGGERLADYIEGYRLDLFLSRSERDVQAVIDSRKCAAALLYAPPAGFDPVEDHVRIAFDADAVVFSEASEVAYKEQGLPGFHAHEDGHRTEPLAPGPHANFLHKLAALKVATDATQEYAPVRLAIVTARNAPAELRVVLTLRQWGVYVDAAYFLGGWDKTPVLRAFRPHVFFDDQARHVEPAAAVVPAGRVPYASGSPLAGPVVADEASGRSVALRRSGADAKPIAGAVESDEG